MQDLGRGRIGGFYLVESGPTINDGFFPGAENRRYARCRPSVHTDSSIPGYWCISCRKLREVPYWAGGRCRADEAHDASRLLYYRGPVRPLSWAHDLGTWDATKSRTRPLARKPLDIDGSESDRRAQSDNP